MNLDESPFEIRLRVAYFYAYIHVTFQYLQHMRAYISTRMHGRSGRKIERERGKKRKRERERQRKRERERDRGKARERDSAREREGRKRQNK